MNFRKLQPLGSVQALSLFPNVTLITVPNIRLMEAPRVRTDDLGPHSLVWVEVSQQLSR